MIPQITPLIGEAEAEAVYKYVKSGRWLTESVYTQVFEDQIADYVGVKHCSAVPNGTIGLMLALMAVGIGKGKRVAVPALTMIATANAATMVGADIVFVDVDDNGCMQIPDEDVDAVIYVDLNGRATTFFGVSKFCRDHKIPLIEDACQALGSRLAGRKMGNLADVGVFSFSPHKIITTGQGGAIVTNDRNIYGAIESLRDFGRSEAGSDEYTNFGINAKFTDLQAVIGIEQLKSIDERVAKKRFIYKAYQDFLGEVMLSEPDVPWFVDVYAGEMDLDVGTRPMYPVIPTDTCYCDEGKYPNAERLSGLGTFLPSSLSLTYAQIKDISSKIKEQI